MTEIQSKLTDLFTFLREVARQKSPPKKQVEDHTRHFFLKNLPSYPTISLSWLVDEDESADGEFLIIRRPVLPLCPRPPVDIADWLEPDWEKDTATVSVKSERKSVKDGKVAVENFSDAPSRVRSLNLWKEARAVWLEDFRPASKAMGVFQTMYEYYGMLQRQSEPLDFYLGEGLLECNGPLGVVKHPVILRQVSLEFRPESNPPEFAVRRTTKAPELYLELLHQVPSADVAQAAKCKDELASLGLEPLGGGDTEGFLRRLIHGVYADRGEYKTNDEVSGPDKVTIRRDPVLVVALKPEGAVGVFEAILQDISGRNSFPESLLNVIGAKSQEPSPADDGHQTFAANEDEEVFLCKEANREQLIVAKQLTRHGCVVVQGPPGTGKTHTIANLLGHLLANGKRVLVTAHTPKALRVLRHKVVKSLQPLCLSVLQKDKKSQEELEAAVTEIQARISQDPLQLERQALRLKEERSKVINEIRKVRESMLEARQDEMTPITFGDCSLRPIDAAEFVSSKKADDGWIPGQIPRGFPLPLSSQEVSELYRTNQTLTAEDEKQLASRRPDLTRLPTPSEFDFHVNEHAELSALDLDHGRDFWEREHLKEESVRFEQMLAMAQKTIGFLAALHPWQLEAIQAGRDGNVSREVWDSLIKLIEETWAEIQQCRRLVVEFGPEILDERDPEDLQPVLRRIISHLEAGQSFGLVTKLTKADCHALITKVRINGRPANPKEVGHFHAADAWVRIQILRRALRQRWERMISALQGPGLDELTSEPENVCRGFSAQIQSCLDWHRSDWSELESHFTGMGFRWTAYLTNVSPEIGVNADLRRLQKALSSELETILQIRVARMRFQQLNDIWNRWLVELPEPCGTEPIVVRSIRQALQSRDRITYTSSYLELERLRVLEADFELRKALLNKLESTASTWADEIRHRQQTHGGGQPPGDPVRAWHWRQIYDELERRAAVSMPALQKRLDELSQRLLGTEIQPGLTGEYVENAAWSKLIRNTTFEQKQALGAYVKFRSKLTKTGQGVRDRQFKEGARQAMADAVSAVPVWIMPLAEVAETFDPRVNHFDVVIIDEASQCDSAALFALYMGKQCVVVGDDEQVSPMAVGQLGEEMSRLIELYLHSIPRRELYDGTTSIYDMAQVFFAGKVVRLREHFRCAPDIIAFSNHLSYGGTILPLKEPSAISLRPNVVPFRVPSPTGSNSKVNVTEAEWVASLICAASEHPAYQVTSSGAPATFGVVSLLGNNQAMEVDRLLRNHLSPAEYMRRHILCGDAADFQGDERDVVFLSLVDAPNEDGPLSLRSEGPKAMFKKRYNVAASRAKDQLWVVHSLDHLTHLKPDDIRRRLIEHAHDPKAWERSLENKFKKTESIFEQRVIRLLTDAGYETIPQFPVGAYRIDIVVTGGGKRLAVECDGEQFHGPEKLQEDLERQAILERLGWRFARIRGNVFFRDPDRAMQPVFRRLDELEITRDRQSEDEDGTQTANDSVTEEIIRLAADLRKQWSAG
jgi:very-short-patch-repair endonuclease